MGAMDVPPPCDLLGGRGGARGADREHTANQASCRLPSQPAGWSSVRQALARAGATAAPTGVLGFGVKIVPGTFGTLEEQLLSPPVWAGQLALAWPLPSPCSLWGPR